jgi:hypothetical protein
MRSNYQISNLQNLSEDFIEKFANSSNFIISKGGKKRCLIKHFNLGLESHYLEINTSEELENIQVKLLSFIENSDNDSIKIILDISLLSRKDVAEIISLITKCSNIIKIELAIVYALAKYKPPVKTQVANAKVMPVGHFYTGWCLTPGLPVMTIVGLGYEKDKALGAIEYVESSSTVVYLPNSSEESYKNDVIEENKNILNFVAQKNKIDYDVHSPVELVFSLESMISTNKSEFKIVLFPFGPKIYYACSLIAAIPHPEASVWYVSGEERDYNTSQDREVVGWIGLSFSIESSDN